MAVYSYRAFSATGERVAGEIEAADERAAIQRLQGQGLTPIEASPAAALPVRRTAPPVVSGGGGGRSGAQVTMLTRELATLLNAGEPLERALAMAGEDCEDRKLGAALARVLGKVRGGSALSAALCEEPRFFPRTYLGLVRAGEATGHLDMALSELANLREKEEDLKRKLTSAMIYPMILTATAVIAVGIMLGVVVPQFAPLFQGQGVQLPASTRFVLALSDGVRTNGRETLIGLLVAVLLLVLVLRREGVRRAADRLLLRLPLLGALARERATAQVARGLSTLLKGGLDLPQALGHLQGMVANRAVASGLAQVGVEVRQGRRLADALAEQGVVVPLGLRLIRSGEESGRLKELSAYVADRFEQRVASRLARLVQILEPLLVVTLVLAVGGIVMSVLTAVLSVNDLAL